MSLQLLAAFSITLYFPHSHGLFKLTGGEVFGTLFHGSEFIEIRTASYVQCYRLCVYATKCDFINYDTKTKMCQLHTNSSGIQQMNALNECVCGVHTICHEDKYNKVYINASFLLISKSHTGEIRNLMN